jgi:hypothetical protein
MLFQSIYFTSGLLCAAGDLGAGVGSTGAASAMGGGNGASINAAGTAGGK